MEKISIDAEDARQIDEWLRSASGILLRSIKEREMRCEKADNLADTALDMIEYARERLLSCTCSARRESRLFL